MNLNLTKPLAFFDLETTGVNIAKDRIVEISILKVFPDGHEETITYRVNPTIPIPEKVSKIHGIFDADVADKPSFKELAPQLIAYLEGCDLAGYNSNMFDIPLLAEEFLRADVDFNMNNRRMIDVQVIFHKMEQRTLSAAYKFFCNKDLVGAHSAEADTRATYEILKAQLDRYDDLDNDMDYLNKFAKYHKFADLAGRIVLNDKDEEVFNFGKYKGQKVEDILDQNPGYFSWMLQGDFPLYTKKILTNIKLRKLNTKE